MQSVFETAAGHVLDYRVRHAFSSTLYGCTCAGSRTLHAQMRRRRRCVAEVYAAQKRDADGIRAGTAIFGAAGHADYEFERRKCRCLQKRCVYSKSANGAGSAAW